MAELSDWKRPPGYKKIVPMLVVFPDGAIGDQ